MASFPLKKDTKEGEGYYNDIKFIGAEFKDGAAYTEGIYGDFNKNLGNAIFSDGRLSNVKVDNFSLSLSFKITKLDKDMPIIVIGRSRRIIEVNVKNGIISLKTTNNSITYPTKNVACVANKWYKLVLVSANKNLELYLDKKQIIQQNNVQLDLTRVELGIDFCSTNTGRGTCFTGYWKNLKIYQGAFDVNPQEPNDDNNNNNNNEKPNDNIVVTPDNNIKGTETALGTWKKTNINISGDVNKVKYLANRNFFLSLNQQNNLNLIWQDSKNLSIYLSVVAKNMSAQNPIKLAIPVNKKLLAATNDDENNLYVMVFDEMKDKTSNDFLTLYKLSSKGNLLAQKKHSSDKKDLDIFRVGNYAGTLVHHAGVLGFFMGRTMNKSSDGLNHQGGIGVTFDANSLDIIKNTGQTSGHSFDNYLTKNETGDFIGIDLGDNYPRGINMHRMTKEQRSSKLVYTFKTEHGSTANGYGTIFPKYEEISTPQKSYYKWSNDNGTYTELGGVVEVEDGYLVIFAGEPDADGKSLNSSRIGDNLDARNLGFVKVAKEFYDYDKYPYNEKKHIISKGLTEKGGFYTFGGNWSPQENQGVNWLTKYKNRETENVKNIKTQKLPNGNILILWSKGGGSSWEPTYMDTLMMVIDKNGKIVQNAVSIGKNIELTRRDEIVLFDNKIVSVQGKDSELQINYLELK
ncbi:MAG: hypothetical protein EAZ85_01720 [Bacteroidetes bacterium]|nr:MAG: hypothetical protein EAZ85_01720 [Bacteroidota bacterium]TAG89951.1 MAG: hypothetical protein EAZ20_05465 [Bacteroidota bacterium]